MENKDTKREPNFKKGAIVVYLEYIAQDKRFMVREVGAGLSEEENKELIELGESFRKKLTTFNKRINKVK